MKKNLFLFTILLAIISYNTAYCQDTTTTKQDALDFIKTNLDQSNNTSAGDASNSFYDIFNDENSIYMDYRYSGETSYSLVSAKSCIITLVETTTGNTKISYSDNDDPPADSPIYSKFKYLKQDTVTIDFSKISRMESSSTSITFISYYNKDLITHTGQITQTPPKKRKNDMISFLRSEEEDLYKQLKRFLVKNDINYTVSPEKTEHFDSSESRFTLSNIDRERCKRLVKAFDFLQKNCGVLKEKF